MSKGTSELTKRNERLVSITLTLLSNYLSTYSKIIYVMSDVLFKSAFSVRGNV